LDASEKARSMETHYTGQSTPIARERNADHWCAMYVKDGDRQLPSSEGR
jgi:hypothetical protein